MLLVGNLWDWLRVVVGLSAVLFWPVAGVLVHLKWRRAAERKEEIKRLCHLASEEAALAELEATAGYGNGYGYGYDGGFGNGSGYGYGSSGVIEDQSLAVASEPRAAGAAGEVPALGVNWQKVMLYPCVVCCCLTRSRCSQCKAIHYCSSKCQIVHWRQGHKDDCQLYSTSIQTNDLGVASHLNVSRLQENESYGDHGETEVDFPATPVLSSFGEPAFSGSGLPSTHEMKDDLEVKHLADDKGRYSAGNSFDNFFASAGSNLSNYCASYSSGGPQSHLCNKVDAEKIQTNPDNIPQPKPSVSEQPILGSSGDTDDTLSKSSQIEPASVVGDGSCVTSGFGISGVINSSLCEPSTSSSGFWEGKLVRNRSRNDAPDDISHCSSNEADESIASHSPINLCSCNASNKIVIPPANRSNIQNVVSDKPQPIMEETRKPTDGTTLSVEETKGYLVLQKPQEMSSHVKGSGSSAKPISEPGEHVPLASDAKMKSMTKGISIVSNLTPSSTEDLIYESEPENRSVDSISFKASESPLSSNAGRDIAQSLKAAKSDNAHGEAACSLELGGHDENDKNASKTYIRKVFDKLKGSTLMRLSTDEAENEIVAKFKGLFPYDLFVKLYNSNKFEFQPSGLVNCGNSCYANAVLQCLEFTPPLTAYFLQGLHSVSCDKRDWCFTCEFESLILKAKEGSYPLNPIRIFSYLQKMGSHLGNGREEDAHEFLRFAIDAMHSICLKEAGMKESGSLVEGTSLIGLTFGGYLRSKITCMRCGGKSERHERMMDLTVEIDGDIGTLEEALWQFTRAETLDGDNKYHCGRCKSYEKARKKLKVLEAPNVLTIVLKRFQSGKYGKLNKTIKFPEILNLAPYVCGTSDKSPIYRLYGVVVHLDVMNAAFSGHYVSYIKNIQNKWFKVDDSKVKAVDLEEVLTKGAYMLLYARCSPRAPRSIRSSLVPRDPRNAKHHTCKSRFSSGSAGDSLNGQIYHECVNTNHASFKPTETILEDYSSSDNSSFFSEVGSCSTDSSNRDSTASDDHFDWNNPWRNLSDSDTSSSSSSPSPLFSRQSPVADLDRYASESGGSCIDNAKRGSSRGFWRSPSSSDLEASNSKEDVHLLCPDSSKQYRKLVSSSSNRQTEANRLGKLNPFAKVKSAVSFRRSAS